MGDKQSEATRRLHSTRRLMKDALEQGAENINALGVVCLQFGNILGDSSSVLEDASSEFQKMSGAVKEGNEKLKLTLALSYSGRWEIIEGVKKLVEDIEEGKVQKEKRNLIMILTIIISFILILILILIVTFILINIILAKIKLLLF